MKIKNKLYIVSRNIMILFIMIITFVYVGYFKNDKLIVGNKTKEISSVYKISEDKLYQLNINNMKNNNKHLNANDYTSEYIYTMKRKNKAEIFSKNSNEKIYPASLTKIMTVLVAIENIDDLHEKVPIDRESYEYVISRNSSLAGFLINEEVTYEDLLYGTMLPSGGEAANSLAIHVAGSIEEFVDLMNDKTVELGLNSTQFANPEGLDDDNQYTTAHDIALLVDYALENETFRKVFSSPTFTTSKTVQHPEGINLRSTVLSRSTPEGDVNFEITGGKSGTTNKAGQNWATVATKDGEEYISVVMGAMYEHLGHLESKQIEDTFYIYEHLIGTVPKSFYTIKNTP